ncbi:MAG: proline iminopeptidase-family hydrolase [Gemmatimonadaceae bacterium]
MSVPGGKVWYRMQARGSGTPIILLHGGPGVPSNYLNPLLALSEDRPVFLYDQLGTGKSDQPADTSLWRTERFVRELQALRDSLGLDEVFIYGHSWGTMLAASYMETKPAGVRGVVFASPCLSAALWSKDADSLVTLLPESTQRVIADANRRSRYDTPQDAAATSEYYARYVMRQPPGVDAESSGTRIATPIYVQMWGPSEFRATGSLKTFDATPGLRAISVPTLFTAGEFDEATPATTRYYASLVPGSEFAVVPGAGHLTMNDNAEGTIRQLRDWLRKVERKVRSGP